MLAINLKMIDTFVRGAGLILTSNLCRLCQETIKAKTKCRVSLQKLSLCQYFMKCPKILFIDVLNILHILSFQGPEDGEKSSHMLPYLPISDVYR